MNIFARKIGFFYKTREWAEDAFSRLVREDIDNNHIARTRAVAFYKEIIYKDGTVVRFLPAVEGARGNRFNVIYFEPKIDREFYINVMEPICRGEIYALSNIDALYGKRDLHCYCITGEEYFYDKRIEDVWLRAAEVDDGR